MRAETRPLAPDPCSSAVAFLVRTDGFSLLRFGPFLVDSVAYRLWRGRDALDLTPQLLDLLVYLLERAGTLVTKDTLLTALWPDANVSQLAIMHRDAAQLRSVVRVDACGLDKRQERQPRRVLDVTRASLLFAQGVILVEGIKEYLLLPALANRLGIDFGQRAVAVVPVGGVDFASIGRLFGDAKITVPLAIVTDADPVIIEAAFEEAFAIDEMITRLRTRSSLRE